MLEPKQKEDFIDNLLIYMKDITEAEGYPRCLFSFRENSDLVNKFLEINSLSYQDLTDILKICNANGYIERMEKVGTGNDFSGPTILTEKGFERANSVYKARINPQQQIQRPSQEFNFNAPVTAQNMQVGNDNTQKTINIENLIVRLMEVIETLPNTPEEKQEAKTLIMKFKEHPIFLSLCTNGIWEFLNYSAGKI